jgi:hypothetical protein
LGVLISVSQHDRFFGTAALGAQAATKVTS